MSNSIHKKYRVLDIFMRLVCGEYVSVKKLSMEYQVSTKSITRDINELKNFLCDNNVFISGKSVLFRNG